MKINKLSTYDYYQIKQKSPIFPKHGDKSKLPLQLQFLSGRVELLNLTKILLQQLANAETITTYAHSSGYSTTSSKFYTAKTEPEGFIPTALQVQPLIKSN